MDCNSYSYTAPGFGADADNRIVFYGNDDMNAEIYLASRTLQTAVIDDDGHMIAPHMSPYGIMDIRNAYCRSRRAKPAKP